LPALEELGWDDDWASAFELLQDDNLVPARVAAQHRGSYVAWSAAGEMRARARGAMFHAHEVGGELPAVGDWVVLKEIDGDHATVAAILPRRSAFMRKHAGRSSTEQVLAANVDMAFLLAGLDDDFSLRRLERYLATAWESGAEPVVVLTKTDVCDDVPTAVLSVESVAIAVPIFPLSNVTGEGLDALAERLEPGRTSVLLGSSGVGKSTLLNTLAGDELMATRELAADGTGRHTTTHRELVRLPNGALVIDTPGLRLPRLWEQAAGLHSVFADIDSLAARCRFRDCSHRGEPGCAVAEAVADGRLDPDRLAGMEKLAREEAWLASRRDERARSERKRATKRLHRELRRQYRERGR
jgi:ribosome biogenesis GTPase